MKECKKCMVVKQESMFYKHKEMGDGLLSFCKECVKSRVTKHRSENVEKARAYDRSRANQPKRVKARQEYAKTEAAKLVRLKANKKWRKNNREKVNAAALVYSAVKSGKIKKEPCSKCGNKKSEGHHEDYSLPLEVIWLCDRHHKDIHNKKREDQRQVKA